MKSLPTLILATAALSLAVVTSIQGAVTPTKAAPGVVPTLLTTFTNPEPAANDYFGFCIAALGTDRVVIGAPSDYTSDAGTVYLFSTNGALLTTFTNPTPEREDHFGVSVGALGPDRVLIGAYQDNTSAIDAGAAYLFSTNGTLLTTFTNPTPGPSDLFGSSVAAMGFDRVLIGAANDYNSGFFLVPERRIFSAPTVRCSPPLPIPGRHAKVSLVLRRRLLVLTGF